MKKILSIMVVGIASAVLVAQAASVTSVNTVGYVNLSLKSGFNLVSLPFNTFGGAAQSLDEVFSTNLVDSSSVYFYVPALPGYDIATYFAGFGWYNDLFEPVGTNKILRGEGFWVYTPSSNNVTMAGEVPGSADSTNTVGIVPGYQLVSFAYPVSIAVTNSGLIPADGDIILEPTAGNTYLIYTYYAGFGWYDDGFQPVDVTLQIGKGYWYRSNAGGSSTWDQVKPY